MQDITIDISHLKKITGASGPKVFIDGFEVEGVTFIGSDLENEEIILRIRPKRMNFKNFDGNIVEQSWEELRRTNKEWHHRV